MFIHSSVKYYSIKADRVRERTTYFLRFADHVLTRRTLPRNSNFCFLIFIHRIFSCQKLWWDQMESLHKLFVEVLWIFFLNRAQKKLSSLVFIIFGMKGFPLCSSEWQIEIEYGACITISAMSNISGGIVLSHLCCDLCGYCHLAVTFFWSGVYEWFVHCRLLIDKS